MPPNPRTGLVANWWLFACLGLGVVGLILLWDEHEVRGVSTIFLAIAAWAFPRLPRAKFIAFTIAAAVVCLVAVCGAVLAFDLYLHHRFFRTGGYNVWGYRGEPVAAKRPNERRLAMLGGSLVFGYGVDVDETIPAYLGRELPNRTVINLGWNGDNAYSFAPTLRDYKYLRLDEVILYSGSLDFVPKKIAFRNQWGIFLATGYLPMLPSVPLTKWMRVNDLWNTGPIPELASDRQATRAADFALRIQSVVGEQLARLAEADRQPPPPGASPECGHFDYYCGYVADAVTEARREGLEVFVVTEPYLVFDVVNKEQHLKQQAALAAMIANRFGTDPRVHYVNMGKAVDLSDPALCYDHVMHLTPKGNAQLAHHLAIALKAAMGS